MSLNMLIISSILTASLMQMEWKRIKALAHLTKKKSLRTKAFSKKKNIGTQSSQMPFYFMMKVKEAFDLRTSYIPFLIRVILLYSWSFFSFICGHFCETPPYLQLPSCPSKQQICRKAGLNSCKKLSLYSLKRCC